MSMTLLYVFEHVCKHLKVLFSVQHIQHVYCQQLLLLGEANGNSRPSAQHTALPPFIPLDS